MGTTHADSGLPDIFNGEVSDREAWHALKDHSRAISLRNTGPETLWISFDGREWFDIPSGTSWGSHAVVGGFWHCTQVGETSFVGNRVDIGLDVPPPLATEG